MRNIIVCYNLKAGQGNILSQLKTAFLAQPATTTWLEINTKLSDGVKQAKANGAEYIVAAGGDGTVNTVAALAYSQNLILGVVPLGTFNHFAKDLKLPLQIDEAVKIICTGQSLLIDVGMLNKQIFLNNSSIGVYPALVEEREKHQNLLGKWLAALVALSKVLTKIRTYRLKLQINNKEHLCRTPFVFVGNNSYGIDKTGFANRTSLQQGELSIYWIKTAHFWHIVRIFLRAILGRAHHDSDFETKMATNIVINLPQKEVAVAYDGEVTLMPTPLHYEIRTKVLKVIT